MIVSQWKKCSKLKKERCRSPKKNLRQNRRTCEARLLYSCRLASPVDTCEVLCECAPKRQVYCKGHEQAPTQSTQIRKVADTESELRHTRSKAVGDENHQ